MTHAVDHNEIDSQIATAYSAGRSIRELTERHAISTLRVYDALRRRGVVTGRSNETARPRGHVPDGWDREHLTAVQTLAAGIDAIYKKSIVDGDLWPDIGDVERLIVKHARGSGG